MVFTCQFLERKEFIFPVKTYWITISLRNDGNEDKALQFSFKNFIYIMGLQKSVMGILIKVNGDVFFEGSFEFCLQGIDKFRYPMIAFIILLAVTNKNI